MKQCAYRLLACVLAPALLLSGCLSPSMLRPTESSSSAEASSAPSRSLPEAPASSEAMDPELVKDIKYGMYVQLNNELVRLVQDIDNYFLVVASEPEFRILPDTGLSYGYRIIGYSTDVLEDALSVAAMEPALGNLDAYVLEMEEPLKRLMETFSLISRSNNYAADQYAKPKEWHAAVYEATAQLEAVVYNFFDELSVLSDEREAQWRDELKADGKLIAYHASCAIYAQRKLLAEIAAQGITDENIMELDLSKIRPHYDELVAAVAELDAAVLDNDQLMEESLPQGHPFDGLFKLLIDTTDYMMMWVETGKGIETPGMLGSIQHVSETLSRCIERYNSVFAG